MKTYKQLADELGVTKEQIRYRANLLPAELLCEERGKVYLTNEAIIKIKDYVAARHTRVLTREMAEITRLKTQLAEADSARNVLIELNKVLREQTAEKDKQIIELTSALNAALQSALQAQALHANEVKALPDKEKITTGFFSRLFRRES